MRLPIADSTMIDRHHEGLESGEGSNATASWTSLDPEMEVLGLVGSSPNPEAAELELGSHEIALNNRSDCSDARTRAKEGSVPGNIEGHSTDVFVQIHQPQTLDEATAAAAVELCSEPNNEVAAAANMAHNPLFERSDSNEICTIEKDMVLLCCRISPIIRDSAFITSVPFHVTWWRDYTRNGCQTWWVNVFLPFMLMCFVAAFLLEVLIEKKDEFKVARNSSVELSLLAFWFLRVFLEPLLAFGSFVYPTVYWVLIGTLLATPESVKSWVYSVLTMKFLDDLEPKVSGHPVCVLGGTIETFTTELAVLPTRLKDLKSPNGAGDVDDEECEQVNSLKACCCPILLFSSERSNAPSSTNSSMGEQHASERGDSYACVCTAASVTSLPESQTCNREDEVLGHWDTHTPAPISCPVNSCSPSVDREQWTKQVVSNGVEHMENPATRKACQDYCQLPHEARRSREEADKEPRLVHWNECGRFDDAFSVCASRAKDMLDAWSCEPSEWGPPLPRLKLPITVSNECGFGVLKVPQCLLSSILPRFGHKARVDEIAYMSAKAANGDQRYYCPRVTLFWLLTMVFVRITLLVTARYEINVVIAATIAAFGLWVQFTKEAFRMDVTAMVWGRVLKGCVLKSAWGVRYFQDEASSGEVTANLLAKWNANVAKESHDLLNSFHTERTLNTDCVPPMTFDTFQKCGGLLIRNLAIIPGRTSLRVRKAELREQVYELGSGTSSIEHLLAAEDIVSRDPCPIGGFMVDSTSECSRGGAPAGA